MAGLKKLVGAYLICLAVVVAVWFIINTVIAESSDFDVLDVWYVLDVLMLIGLVLGIIYNYANKQTVKGDDGPVTRRYLEANVTFYLTAALTILFLPQLDCAAGSRLRQPGRQPSGLGHLGGRRRAPAHHAGSHRLSALVQGIPVLTQIIIDRRAETFDAPLRAP